MKTLLEKIQELLENETIQVHGTVEKRHFDKDGNLLGVYVDGNMVTTAGLGWISGALQGATATPANAKYIASGTGVAGAARTDTQLGTEVTDNARAVGTQTQQQTTLANDTYRCVGTIAYTTGHAITEAGILSATSTGTLLCRQTFSAINVANGDSIQFTWNIAFS